MTHWNIPKIREECLKLMGHAIVDIGDSRKFSPYGDCEQATYFKVVSPMGETRIVRYLDCAMSNAPDPTCSLDDALPLIEKYGMALAPPSVVDSLWLAQVIPGYPNVARLAKADTPCLAICLCALRCEDHNLDDFKLDGEA